VSGHLGSGEPVVKPALQRSVFCLAKEAEANQIKKVEQYLVESLNWMAGTTIL
jgi:hypothetical protein